MLYLEIIDRVVCNEARGDAVFRGSGSVSSGFGESGRVVVVGRLALLRADVSRRQRGVH